LRKWEQPMTTRTALEFSFQFRSGQFGRRSLSDGPTFTGPPLEPGRAPRLARLMALAIRFEHLLDNGVIADYADLARLGHVGRTHITHIMNLRLLAPDIQEQILFLPRTQRGRDPIHLGQLQPITLEPDWRKQRIKWAALLQQQMPAAELAI
jgi:hypothetical protein